MSGEVGTTFPEINGVPAPTTPWFLKKTHDFLEYEPNDGDVVISSYPKTGTTWLEYIVLQILSDCQSYPSLAEVKMRPIPGSSSDNSAAQVNGVNIVRHHFPLNTTKINRKAKYFYTYRRPEDTLFSLYHYARNLKKEDIQLEAFFERWISGKTAYGCYFKHVASSLDAREFGNVFHVSYEKLLDNTEEQILRISKFLGEEHHAKLTADKSLVADIKQRTSFSHMKTNLSMSNEELKIYSGRALESVDFFRNGTSGDGKKHLTPDQLRRIEEKAKNILNGTEIYSEWYGDA